VTTAAAVGTGIASTLIAALGSKNSFIVEYVLKKFYKKFCFSKLFKTRNRKLRVTNVFSKMKLLLILSMELLIFTIQLPTVCFSFNYFFIF